MLTQIFQKLNLEIQQCFLLFGFGHHIPVVCELLYAITFFLIYGNESFNLQLSRICAGERQFAARNRSISLNEQCLYYFFLYISWANILYQKLFVNLTASLALPFDSGWYADKIRWRTLHRLKKYSVTFAANSGYSFGDFFKKTFFYKTFLHHTNLCTI